jgi:hypothetical protein
MTLTSSIPHDPGRLAPLGRRVTPDGTSLRATCQLGERTWVESGLTISGLLDLMESISSQGGRVTPA